MKKVKKIVKYWGPPVLWAGVIFCFSTLPQIRTTEIYWQDFILKKTAHMVEYGILAILLYRALKYSGAGVRKAAIFSILIAVVYAMTDEFHQSFVLGRESRVRDVIFDTIGSILAITFFRNKI